MERNALRHTSLFKALPSLPLLLFFVKAVFPTVTSAWRRFPVIHINHRDIHSWCSLPQYEFLPIWIAAALIWFKFASFTASRRDHLSRSLWSPRTLRPCNFKSIPRACCEGWREANILTRIIVRNDTLTHLFFFLQKMCIFYTDNECQDKPCS